MTLTLPVSYIDAALEGLPKPEPGTQFARDIAAIRDALLSAKARATTMEGKASWAN